MLPKHCCEKCGKEYEVKKETCGECGAELEIIITKGREDLFGKKWRNAYGEPLIVTTKRCPNKKHWWDGHESIENDNDIHTW